VEQLASLRSIPNLQVIRPADGNEVVAAWELALQTTDKPTALILTRQNLAVIEGTKENARQNVAKGGYVVSAEEGTLDGVLLATGSEVKLAIDAQVALKQQGKHVRVISLPSFDLFEAQDAEYKEGVLPKEVTKRLAIEAGTSYGWGQYVGLEGGTVTVDRYGASAPGDKIFEEYGFTVENIVSKFLNL
ncbi:MAG: transketolase, partial [Streptococcaceae bacterium]|nr:transketolase [Streptococcaceae bacterium]